MLPSGWIAVAVGLRLLAGGTYLVATWRGRAKPSLVSWFFWGFTALIAFAVELSKGAGVEAITTLAIGVSPFAVLAVALWKHAGRLTFSRTDKWSAALTLAGIGLWLVTHDPLMALLMSIFVDICSDVPTLVKAFYHPRTEHPGAYGLSALSMIVTLLTIHNWTLTNWLFTAYILTINVTILLDIVVLSKMRRLWLAFREVLAEDRGVSA